MTLGVASSIFEKTDRTPDGVAAEWAARMDRGELTGTEKVELENWLDADPRHRGALIRAQVIWQATDRMAALNPGCSFGTPAVSAPPGAFMRPLPARRAPTMSRRTMVAATAGLVLAAWPDPSREMGRFYHLRDSAPRSIAVAGGTIRLDCFSSLLVGRENARLLAGRCVLSSIHEAELSAGSLTFRSQGRLEVAQSDKETSGLLLSGSAVVIDASDRKRFVLAAGDRIALSEGGAPRLFHLTMEDLARETGWERGVLELQGMTLGQAAAIFNRYNATKLVVHGPAAERVLMGSFALSDPEAFARAAQAILHVEYVAGRRRLDIF